MPDQSNSHTSLLDAANRAFTAGDHAGARKTLEQALALAPRDFPTLSSLGAVCYQSQDYSAAQDYFRRASEIEPKNVAVLVQFAHASLKLERIDDFEWALGLALDLEPENRDALKMLGDLNLQNGKFHDAARAYTEIVRAHENDIESLLALGVCFFKLQDYETAKTVFERVLQFEPGNQLALENLEAVAGASVRQSAGASDVRQQKDAKLIEESPSSLPSVPFQGLPSSDAPTHRRTDAPAPDALTHRLIEEANAAFGAGNFGIARQLLVRAKESRPDNVPLLVQLALVELRLENIEAFEAALGRALELQPGNRDALRVLADLNFQNGDFKNAAQSYINILRSKPDDMEAMLPLGVCFYKLEDFETAKGVFEEVLKHEPGNEAARENLRLLGSTDHGTTDHGTTGPWDHGSSWGQKDEVGGQKSEIRNQKSEISSLPSVPIESDSQAAPTDAQTHGRTDVPSSRRTDAQVIDSLLDQAHFFEEVGNHEAALETLEEALELAPREAKLLSAVGSAHFTAGQYEMARERFRRLIEVNPRNADAYTRLAMTALQLGRVDEFESALGLALEIDPDNREALRFLAKTNLEQERVRDAGKAYAKVLEKHPDDIESLLGLGLCFYKGAEYEAARMVYERVLEAEPENPTAKENLLLLERELRSGAKESGDSNAKPVASGKVKQFLDAAEAAFGSQNLAGAREALKSALELMPDSPDILSALGSLCFQLGNMNEARDYLERLVRKAPADPGKWVQLALAHYRLQEIPEFERALQRALDLDPDNLEALRLLAHLNFNEGSVSDAAHTYGKILKQRPDDIEVILALGVCFFKTGDHDAAQMMFERALELDPGNSIARENLEAVGGGRRSEVGGQICEQKGAKVTKDEISLDTDRPTERPADALVKAADEYVTQGRIYEAREKLRKALEFVPDDHELIAAIGCLSFQLEDWDESERMLRRAVEAAPNSADYQTRFAMAALKLSRVDDFESALGRALELDRNYKPALRLLADLNLSNSRFEDAAHTYKRLLDQDPDDVTAMLPLGVCFYKVGDFDAAKMVFDRVLELDPTNEVAQENRRLLDDDGQGDRPQGHGTTGPQDRSGGNPKSEIRNPKSEDHGRAEDGGQVSEGGGQRAEGPTGKAEGEIQRSTFNAQRSMDEKDEKQKATKAAKADSSLRPSLPSVETASASDLRPPSSDLRPLSSDHRRTVSPTHRLTVIWEGSQFVHHSLALINRELCLQLMDAGHEVSIVPYEPDQFEPGIDGRFVRLAGAVRKPLPRPAGVHVRHQWPLNFEPPKEGRWIVIQPWEFGAVPKDWVGLMRNYVDELWVPSNYVRTCFIESGVPESKVVVIPNGVDPDLFTLEARPMALATKKRFKFLFVGGTIGRKGADILLNTYVNSFTSKDDVCLIIKDLGGKTFYRGQTLEAVIEEIQERPEAPEILHLTENLSPNQLPSLYRACDCLVHPYRGEGFGLPVLEAMACGLPVIVTAGGATDDFATDEVAIRIPSSRKAIGKRVDQFELAGEGWLLEPDAGELATQMRRLFGNPEAGRKLGKRASEHVRSHWTWRHAAQKAEQRIGELVNRGGLPERFRQEGSSGPANIEVPTAGRLGSLKKVHGLIERKKYLKAWNAAIEAIELRPFHPDAYLQLADIALSAGDEKQALICADRLIAMTPQWEMAKRVHASLTGSKKLRKSKIKWTPLPDLPKKPRISVCLIAKNEEEFIGRCLSSVKPIAHQIVVVDTGSADRTIEIAKKHGAEVHQFQWNDNFADARNAAHEHARGDWVLVLDCDEELPVESHEKLWQDVGKINVLGLRIPICNLHESNNSVTYVPRLFRNAPALFFVGRVHEQIYASVLARKSDWGMDAELGSAMIVHHGYDPGLVKRRQKIKRNLALMEKAVEEMPHESALLMNYGLDLVNDGRLEEGLEKYRTAVRVMLPHRSDAILPEVRERLVTIFGVHLVKAGRFEELLELMNGKLAADSGPTASMHFLSAAGLIKLNRPAEAIPHLRECIAKRNAPTLTPACHELTGPAPHHMLAECLSKVGQNEEAERNYKLAIDATPDAVPIIHDYAHFLHRTDRPKQALELLNGANEKGINDERLWHLGSFIANSRPDFLEFALDWTGEAIRFFPKHEAIRWLRAEVLLKSGRAREALPLFESSTASAEPSGRAAVFLCKLAQGESLTGVPSEIQEVVSREFVAWYRRLLSSNAEKTVRAVNAGLSALESVLPTAARILREAVSHAE